MIKFIIVPNSNLNFKVIKLDLIQVQKDGKDVWIVNEAAYTRQPDPKSAYSNYRSVPWVDVPYGIPWDARSHSKGLDSSIVFDTKDEALLASEGLMRERIRERIESLRKQMEQLETQIETWKEFKPKAYMANMLLKPKK